MSESTGDLTTFDMSFPLDDAAAREHVREMAAAQALETYLVLMSNVQNDPGNARQAANAVFEILGLSGKGGPGGGHHHGLSITASLGEEALRGAFQGLALLAGGNHAEPTELSTLEGPSEGDSVSSWSFDDEPDEGTDG